MKLAGHTMGTPDKTLEESMKFFSELGFDGIEIRCADDGHLNIETFDFNEAPCIKKLADKFNIEIVCLTPYYQDYIDPYKRDSEIANMKKTVDVASALGCTRVRARGGIEPLNKNEYAHYWKKTVSGLLEVAEYALPKGVDICIETHGGNLTMSATDTVRMVKDIGLKNVGIIFDYPWVYFAGKENPQEAVSIAAPYIKHVHVKDFTYISDQKTTTLFGDGILEWEVIFKALIQSGYDGYMSDEYEKYHRDYLPEPEIGMKQDIEVIHSMLKKYGAKI